ncbi:MAG: CHRD domain-containing protein [Pyrinomonadaceae bacterium]
MKNLWTKKSLVLSSIIFSLLVFTVTWVSADGGKDGDNTIRARLIGYEETPLSLSTTGRGNLRARIDDAAQTITYRLSYSNLEGTTTLAAHIHLGQRRTTGGVSAFLCGGGDKPACTPTAGTITGVIDAADVIGPTGQGIAAGEFNELVRAIRSGYAYANVHTNKYPTGEIRGQIRGDDNDDDDEEDN